MNWLFKIDYKGNLEENLKEPARYHYFILPDIIIFLQKYIKKN